MAHNNYFFIGILFLSHKKNRSEILNKRLIAVFLTEKARFLFRLFSRDRADRGRSLQKYARYPDGRDGRVDRILFDHAQSHFVPQRPDVRNSDILRRLGRGQHVDGLFGRPVGSRYTLRRLDRRRLRDTRFSVRFRARTALPSQDQTRSRAFHARQGFLHR